MALTVMNDFMKTGPSHFHYLSLP